MTTGKVHFTEDQSTNLATLYGRALDARADNPILADPTAEDAVRRIDYDFGKFGMNNDLAISVAARAKVFDDWTRRFLAGHPDATVLHLGCGMDSRVHRLDPPPTVRWFDVDFPTVIALREQIYPGRDGYRMIGASVTDPGWLAQVPTDRPTLVVAEGLTMYLPPEEGAALLRRLAATLPGGEMTFDFYSRTGIKLQKTNPVVRRAGATLRWGIEDPRELEPLGLTLVECLDASYFATSDVLSRLSPAMRWRVRLAALVPAFRSMGRMLRYRF
ncbi:class I SAM-dependent methyltransferase [Plantactinospora sp. CA-290183]|uniref:class I SAM-dependent methyltransferase n=1 Tax=Plantactinospora sp. CA-290183 TaxID=3240006 RepID=UPI003D8BCB7F